MCEMEGLVKGGVPGGGSAGAVRVKERTTGVGQDAAVGLQMAFIDQAQMLFQELRANVDWLRGGDTERLVKEVFLEVGANLDWLMG